MRSLAKSKIYTLALACAICCTAVVRCAAAIEYLGKAVMPGTATDLSGLTKILEDGGPDNRFGSFGSAIDYMGDGNRYVVCCDRGPGDGAVSFDSRMHQMDISVAKHDAKWQVDAKLISTTLLKNQAGKNYIGISSAYSSGLRLDCEGIRLSNDGTCFISDEYGPCIKEFSSQGVELRTVGVPAKFLIDNPNADADKELMGNKKGRQTNRGLEGLALSPDGKTLFAIMQSPLIQDGGINTDGKRIGINIRMLKIDLKTGQTAEYVYQLKDKGYGVNELLAVNDHQFLVIERDGKKGSAAKNKSIYLIDISGATDVSGVAALPSAGLPAGIKAVSKNLFIDVLDPKFGLAGDDMPEKIEGLAWGPDLADGRHLLLVTSDNDFLPDVPSVILAFAVDTSDVPGYERRARR